MDLDRLWSWSKKKMGGVSHEASNPAMDDLRERLAELAGVDLKQLLDDMKRTEAVKKRAGGGGKGRKTTTTTDTVGSDEMAVVMAAEGTTSGGGDAHSAEYEATKKYKEILHRSHIVGASQTAVDKYDFLETATDLPGSVSAKNIKKTFLGAVHKSPPKRVALETQREIAKPIIIPNPEETKAASIRLQRKLAKQRADRKKASGEDEETVHAEPSSDEDTPRERPRRIPKWEAAAVAAPGAGMGVGASSDMDGMVYLARMAESVAKMQVAAHKDGGSGGAGGGKKVKDEKAKSKPHSKAATDKDAGHDSSAESSPDRARPEGGDRTRASFDEDGDKGDPGRAGGDGSYSASDMEARLYCAKALCNWTRNPANAGRIAKEGAIRALLHLALEPIPRILFYCAGAFRFMSEVLVLASAMIDEGAISVLSDIIKTGVSDEDIIGNLAITLVNLTRVNGKEGQIVEAMIHQALTNVITFNPGLSSSCARGLYNLTCVDTSYPFIEKVVRALIQLASGSTTTNVKHICAAALCNLADLKPVRLRLVEEGVISVLNTLAHGSETRTRRICAVILQNLSASKGCRVEMVARSAVQAAHMFSSDADPIILRCIGLTLSRLSTEPVNSTRIIHELGLAALCNIAVKFPTVPGISHPVSTAFQLLSANESARINIVQEGSVAALAALLKGSTDVYTLQNSLLAICNLLSEHENHLAIVQQGLIATLMMHSEHINTTIQDFCSLGFLNLSLAEDSRKHAVNAGAVAAIISLAEGSSSGTKTRCAAALMNLATTPSGGNSSALTPVMERVISDGAIPALVELLSVDNVETVRYACAALCRLCVASSTGIAIMESGAIPTLVQRAIEGELQTQQYCGAVISSLSSYGSCRVPLFETNCVAALKQLAEIDDDVTKQRCLAAFANLSCEVSIQYRMVEQGVVGVIAALAESYQEITYKYCARALCNLACAEGARLRVATEGGMRALLMISMVRSVDVHTKYWCVVALANLLDTTSVDFMLTEGLVPAIANMSRNAPTDDTVLQCAWIFNYLSSHPPGLLRMAEKPHILHALYEMINAPVAGTRLLAARTTSNILFCLDTREKAIDAGALATLQAGIVSGSEDASLHCLKALFSVCKVAHLLPIVAATPLPIALCRFAVRCSDDKHNLAVKTLVLLAWSPEARKCLLKRTFADAFMQLLAQNLHPSSLNSFALMLRYLCASYQDRNDLLDVNVFGAADALYRACPSLSPNSVYGSKVSAGLDVTKCLAAVLRSLASPGCPPCTEQLATAQTVDMLLNIGTVCSREPAVVYDVAVAIYCLAAHNSATRVATSTPTTVQLLQLVSTFPDCVELATITICHYLLDPRSRKTYANRDIVLVVMNVIQHNQTNHVLFNAITCLYLLSQRADCVEFLADPAIQADIYLLKLSKSEDAQIRANCARTLKNMTSDSSESVPDGAIASLLSMYFEGKDRMDLKDELGAPAMAPLSTEDKAAPACVDDAITDCVWYEAKECVSGGPAGSGPPPPEPPRMDSEASTETSVIDEPETAELDSRTKMSFAKMQTSQSLRDQCLLTDTDFETVRDGAADDLWVDTDANSTAETAPEPQQSPSAPPRSPSDTARAGALSERRLWPDTASTAADAGGGGLISSKTLVVSVDDDGGGSGGYVASSAAAPLTDAKSPRRLRNEVQRGSKKSAAADGTASTGGHTATTAATAATADVPVSPIQQPLAKLEGPRPTAPGSGYGKQPPRGKKESAAALGLYASPGRW